ncbi:MAG TPA: hypothetical protein VJ254_22360 [Streptosporangiaceae bacterium]|nr:hypothetical protein [Streptosporangiaceae bacterium]
MTPRGACGRLPLAVLARLGAQFLGGFSREPFGEESREYVFVARLPGSA